MLFSLSAQAQDNITLLKKQLALARTDTCRSRLLYDIATHYDEVSHDSCLYFLTQSLQVAQRSHDPQATAKAMHRLGYTYIYYLNDNGKAMGWLNKSIAIAKKGNDYVNLSRCYRSLAVIALQQHIGNQIELAERSLGYAKKTNDWRELNEGYAIVSYVNRLAKNYKQAEAASFQTMLISEKHNFDSWFANCLGYGRILLLEGKQAQAQQVYRKLNAVKHKLAMSNGYFNYMNSRAALQLGLKNYGSAQRILVEELAAEKAKARPDTFHLDYIYRTMLAVYDGQGDTRKAYAVSIARTDVLLWLEAKRLSRNAQVQMAQLKATLAIEKKEVEIALLAQQQKQQRTYLIGAILVAALLLGFLFVLQRNNQRIKQQRTELSVLNATQHKLFAILSHDLQSPVANLETNMMLQDWGALSQEAFGQSIRKLSQDIGYIRGILQNVLHWSVSQLGGMLAHVETMAISPIVEEQIQLLQSIAQTKGIQLVNQIPTEVQLRVDKNHLAIIFRNLLQNALKFTKAGGTVHLGYTERQGVQTITIADTGIGMSQDLLDHLFQLGKSSSRIGTAQEEGTGLGLVLVAELVKVNQGQISVASQVNKGTTFSLHFAQPRLPRSIVGNGYSMVPAQLDDFRTGQLSHRSENPSESVVAVSVRQ